MKNQNCFVRLLVLLRLFVFFDLEASAAPAELEIKAEKSGNKINYESAGNLGSHRPFLGKSLSEISLETNPVDLVTRAVEVFGRDREGGLRLMLAGHFLARFDMERVADRTAHQAWAVLEMEFNLDKFTNYGMEHPETFQRAIGDVLEWSQKRQPSLYYPSWMIQHGMGAFKSHATNDSLRVDQTQQRAWQKANDDFKKLASRIQKKNFSSTTLPADWEASTTKGSECAWLSGVYDGSKATLVNNRNETPASSLPVTLMAAGLLNQLLKSPMLLHLEKNANNRGWLDGRFNQFSVAPDTIVVIQNSCSEISFCFVEKDQWIARIDLQVTCNAAWCDQPKKNRWFNFSSSVDSTKFWIAVDRGLVFSETQTNSSGWTVQASYRHFSVKLPTGSVVKCG